jgi:REP element-mobilizing transposase RayT
MSHTYAQSVIHVVFSTKDRRKAISPELQPRVWSYAAGICKNLGILVHAVGGIEDHIHFLIQVPPSVAVAKAVLAIKSNSSRCGPEERRNCRHGCFPILLALARRPLCCKVCYGFIGTNGSTKQHTAIHDGNYPRTECVQGGLRCCEPEGEQERDSERNSSVIDFENFAYGNRNGKHTDR